MIYPMTTGPNFDEVLRVIDTLHLTARHGVATPVSWRLGEDVIIAGSGLRTRKPRKKYPKGWRAPRPNVPLVPQPQ